MVEFLRSTWICFRRESINWDLDNLEDSPNPKWVDCHWDRAKEERRSVGSVVRFTFLSWVNWGKLSKDCNPTLMIERTRRLTNSSVRPSIDEQRAQLSKTNSLIYSEKTKTFFSLLLDRFLTEFGSRRWTSREMRCTIGFCSLTSPFTSAIFSSDMMRRQISLRWCNWMIHNRLRETTRN